MLHLLALFACAGGDTKDSDTGSADDTGTDTADTADTSDTTDTVTEETDADADGFTVTAGDCDDTNATINPAASETCDGEDDDCDGEVDEEATDAPSWYTDADGDGYGDSRSGVAACDAPPDTLVDGSDCDDEDALVNPAAEEVCDGVDNNCDLLPDAADATDAQKWYLDADFDGYGNEDIWVVHCDAPEDWVLDGTDCEDGDASISPGAPETCNGEDDDCDGDVDETCG